MIGGIKVCQTVIEARGYFNLFADIWPKSHPQIWSLPTTNIKGSAREVIRMLLCITVQ